MPRRPQLRKVLMDKKDDFLRQVTGKVLGYALGRSLQDGDSCTISKLADTLQKDNYGPDADARSCSERAVAHSQGGKVTIEAAAAASS